jgi:hypothetical protein
MAMDLEQAKLDTIETMVESLLEKYGPEGATEATLRDLAEAMAPGIVEGILQHILANATAGGDPVL